MKIRDVVGQDYIDDLVDVCVAKGMDKKVAEAYMRLIANSEKWNFQALAKTNQRLLDLIRERHTTMGELLNKQEIRTIITEEWNTARRREHASDLN
jgi:hypothetical protein